MCTGQQNRPSVMWRKATRTGAGLGPSRPRAIPAAPLAPGHCGTRRPGQACDLSTFW